MTNTIHIKLLSENALIYFKQNLKHITEKIINNDDNKWIDDDFPKPIFVEKKFTIQEFELEDNPGSDDKEIDFRNSVTLYEKLKCLPRHILCDERFWLWLHLEKFYLITKNMMRIRGESTIRDHWLHTEKAGHHRRGLMFGVLSRMFFRVELSVDDSNKNKYELSKWVVENPLRFRNLSWRSYSSLKHLVRGILRGEKRAIDEYPDKENNDYYVEIAKYVSIVGSVRLLDAISEEDIAEIIYEKMIEYIKNEEK